MADLSHVSGGWADRDGSRWFRGLPFVGVVFDRLIDHPLPLVTKLMAQVLGFGLAYAFGAWVASEQVAQTGNEHG